MVLLLIPSWCLGEHLTVCTVRGWCRREGKPAPKQLKNAQLSTDFNPHTGLHLCWQWDGQSERLLARGGGRPNPGLLESCHQLQGPAQAGSGRLDHDDWGRCVPWCWQCADHGSSSCKHIRSHPPAVPRMLFHNRPVKAAMGSVIANGGVQLSEGKSLVNFLRILVLTSCPIPNKKLIPCVSPQSQKNPQNPHCRQS